ncbi:uncharacterized protein METZ01_LOCUS418784 [marine metagenome]|uniref:Uncharacterized protein n=1 Tax=marine metagenome TaxID=408172 RepID=A0A382X4X8_9ZZZZ
MFYDVFSLQRFEYNLKLMTNEKKGKPCQKKG